MPQPYSQLSDTELLQLLSESDKAAFTELYNRYWEKLFYVAGKKIINLGEAESLVHDVLADLWTRRETIDVQKELSHYLAAAMKYRVIRWMDQQKRAADYKASIPYAEQADTQTPETILAFEELKDKLSLLVKNLPEKCRLVYGLKEKGFTQKQISESLQISENTVEQHLSKAARTLRAGLSQLFTTLFSSML